MRPIGLTKLLLGLGPLSPILLVVGFAGFPAPAQSDRSAASDPAFLAAHTGAVIAQAYVRSFAALAFFALALGVALVLSRGPRTFTSTLAAAGGAGASVLMLVAQATLLAAAFAQRDHAGAGVISLFDSLDEAALAVSSLPAVFLFGATAYGLGPGRSRWFRGFCWVGVPLAVIDALGYDGGPLAAVSVLGLVYFLLWGLVAPVVLLRQDVRTGPTAPHTPQSALADRV